MVAARNTGATCTTPPMINLLSTAVSHREKYGTYTMDVWGIV